MLRWTLSLNLKFWGRMLKGPPRISVQMLMLWNNRGVYNVYNAVRRNDRSKIKVSVNPYIYITSNFLILIVNGPIFEVDKIHFSLEMLKNVIIALLQYISIKNVQLLTCNFKVGTFFGSGFRSTLK
jgi:hypothetical protein